MLHHLNAETFLLEQPLVPQVRGLVFCKREQLPLEPESPETAHSLQSCMMSTVSCAVVSEFPLHCHCRSSTQSPQVSQVSVAALPCKVFFILLIQKNTYPEL